MHDNEDPILTAIQEDAEKIEWQDRKDLWQRMYVRGVCALQFIARIVKGMFI